MVKADDGNNTLTLIYHSSPKPYVKPNPNPNLKSNPNLDPKV